VLRCSQLANWPARREASWQACKLADWRTTSLHLGGERLFVSSGHAWSLRPSGRRTGRGRGGCFAVEKELTRRLVCGLAFGAPKEKRVHLSGGAEGSLDCVH